MKKIVSVFLAAVLFAVTAPLRALNTGAAEKPATSAAAAVLISADTGEVIYKMNSERKLPMASTTKIMTVLLTLESGDLYEEFTVDSEAIKVEGSSMGLVEGDTVTKYALCCGMMLPSGNDAANAAAVKISGSLEAFAQLMNEKARKLGLSHTYFVTPSGLEGEGHGSSAYDMALLAREALKNETFREICSSETIQVEFGAPPYKRWLKNTNKLLTMYDGVYGVKTGFTDEAGRCLVSACERNGVDLICVTLNARDDWNDHIALYNYGFETVGTFSPEIPGNLSADVVGSDKEKVALTAGDAADTVITTMSESSGDFGFTVLSAPFVYAPVKAGEEIAQLRISYKGREVRTIPLYSAENADAAKPDRSGKKQDKLSKIKKKLGSLLP